MADTTEDTPAAAASAPTPRRRRAKAETATPAGDDQPKRGRAKRTPAAAAATASKPKATRKTGPRRAAAKPATEKVVRAVKPRAKKAVATVKAGVDDATKPANRKRLIVGAAAAVGIAAGVAATLSRRKIAKVGGEVIDSVNEKVEAVIGGKDEPAKPGV